MSPPIPLAVLTNIFAFLSKSVGVCREMAGDCRAESVFSIATCIVCRYSFSFGHRDAMLFLLSVFPAADTGNTVVIVSSLGICATVVIVIVITVGIVLIKKRNRLVFYIFVLYSSLFHTLTYSFIQFTHKRAGRYIQNYTQLI